MCAGNHSLELSSTCFVTVDSLHHMLGITPGRINSRGDSVYGERRPIFDGDPTMAETPISFGKRLGEDEARCVDPCWL